MVSCYKVHTHEYGTPLSHKITRGVRGETGNKRVVGIGVQRERGEEDRRRGEQSWVKHPFLSIHRGSKLSIHNIRTRQQKAIPKNCVGCGGRQEDLIASKRSKPVSSGTTASMDAPDSIAGANNIALLYRVG